jgi:hypothetical protein
MLRIVVISSLCLAACDVGQLPAIGATNDSGTGGGDTGGNGCIDLATDIPPGHHVPPMTQGCMSQAACHNEALGLGTAAPAYTYAGLVYKADKTTPAGGATVIVKLGAAEKHVTVSDNGEFALVAGVAGIDPPSNTAPANTSATACPSLTPMVGVLTQGGGDCAKSGCHTPGVGQGVIYIQ